MSVSELFEASLRMAKSVENPVKVRGRQALGECLPPAIPNWGELVSRSLFKGTFITLQADYLTMWVFSSNSQN
jgi:hypothetical protein